MPVGGDGSGAVSGTSPQSWVTIECPGFCPIWPCQYVYVQIPAMEYYVEGDPLPHTFPYSGWLLLTEGVPVYGDFPTCNKGWSGSLTTIDGDGVRTMDVVVCCNDEKTSYPTVHFNFSDSIVDPPVSICVRNICLTEIVCRCTNSTDTTLPGFNHGVASAPHNGWDSVCSTTTINDLNSLTTWEVRCLCNGACDCTGIPTALNVSIQCDSGSGYAEVGSGTISFTGPNAAVDLPHWEGTVTLVPGLGSCSVTGYLVCRSNPPDSYDVTFGQPSCGFPCPCFDLITALGSSGVGTGECDPFSITIAFSGWIGCFTGGGGAGPRLVITAAA